MGGVQRHEDTGSIPVASTPFIRLRRDALSSARLATKTGNKSDLNPRLPEFADVQMLGDVGILPSSRSFQTFRVRVSVVPGTTRALARRFGSNRSIGETPMKTDEAAELPGTGRTARSSLPNYEP